MLDRSTIEKLMELVNEQTSRLKQLDEIPWAEVAEWDRVANELKKELKEDGVRIERLGNGYALFGSAIGSAWITVGGVSVRLQRHNPLRLRLSVYPFGHEDGAPVQCDQGVSTNFVVNCAAENTPVRLKDGTESRIAAIDDSNYELPYYVDGSWYGANELEVIE